MKERGTVGSVPLCTGLSSSLSPYLQEHDSASTIQPISRGYSPGVQTFRHLCLSCARGESGCHQALWPCLISVCILLLLWVLLFHFLHQFACYVVVFSLERRLRDWILRSSRMCLPLSPLLRALSLLLARSPPLSHIPPPCLSLHLPPPHFLSPPLSFSLSLLSLMHTEIRTPTALSFDNYCSVI